MMMGLAGLVGVDPIKGGAWEFKCKMTQHEEMMKILSSLLVSGMEKVGVVHTYAHTLIHTLIYIHTHIHTYTHTHIHTYTHTHIHTYIVDLSYT